MDIKMVTGNEHWDTTTIQKMLKNEKYKGDTTIPIKNFLANNSEDDIMNYSSTNKKERLLIKKLLGRRSKNSKNN